MMNYFKRDFITKEGEKNVLEYKYEGSDASIWNHLVIDVAAKWLVYYTPKWIA
jgi:hypothetical protein